MIVVRLWSLVWKIELRPFVTIITYSWHTSTLFFKTPPSQQADLWNSRLYFQRNIPVIILSSALWFTRQSADSESSHDVHTTMCFEVLRSAFRRSFPIKIKLYQKLAANFILYRWSLLAHIFWLLSCTLTFSKAGEAGQRSNEKYIDKSCFWTPLNRYPLVLN